MALPTNIIQGNAAHVTHHNTIHALMPTGESVQVKTKAGTPVDGDFTSTPANGTLALNTTTNRMWARIGGVWVDLVASHEGDATSVHGITDTAQLALRNAANTFTATNTFTGEQQSQRILVKEYPGVDPRHPDFGADPTGVVDSATAINNAIEYCFDNVAVGTSRFAKRPLYLGAGDYKTLSPILVKNALSFHMHGAGSLTKIIPSATMANALLLDGVKYSEFRDFRIEGLGFDSAPVITDVIGWESLTPVGGSVQPSAGCLFEKIIIRNLKYVNGWSVGSRSTAGIQISEGAWRSCITNGPYNYATTSWPTYHQAAMAIGNGTEANNLNHYIYGATLAGCRYGAYVNNVANTNFIGGDCGSSEVDFKLEGSGIVSVHGFRSEGSKRLLACSAGVNTRLMLSNIKFSSDGLATDNRVVDTTFNNGFLSFQNVYVRYAADAARIIKFRVNGGGNTVYLNGCMVPCLVDDVVFADDSNRPATVVIGYTELHPGTNAVVKITPFATMHTNLALKEGGTSPRMGVATLVAGTVTVGGQDDLTTSSRIFLTPQNSSGTAGSVYVSAKAAGDSFTITSTSGTDTRQVAWMITRPS